MQRFMRYLLVFVLAFVGIGTALAQDAPAQLDAALADLSQRVGQTVTISDLDGWTWSQDNYPDASLGCPQPDEMYAQVLTSGYQFLLDYQGTTYDYRVSTDQTTVILCAMEQRPTATPVPGEPTAEAPAQPTLVPTNVPAALPPADALTLLAPENYGALVELSRIEGPLGATVAWSPDNTLLAVASQDPVALGVWLYDLAALDTAPRLLPTPDLVTAVAFAADGAVLATGDESGTVRLWDLTEGTAEPEMASFAAHQDAITDLRFSPDGKLLATVGADFSVALWGVPAEAQG